MLSTLRTAVLSALRVVVLSALRVVVLSALCTVVLFALRTVVLSALRVVVLSALRTVVLSARPSTRSWVTARCRLHCAPRSSSRTPTSPDRSDLEIDLPALVFKTRLKPAPTKA